MGYGDEVKSITEKPRLKTYSEKELRDFDKELEPFKEIGQVTGRKVLLHAGWLKYLETKDAITTDGKGGWSVKGYKDALTNGVDTTHYAELQNKLSQLNDYQGRIQYAERKKMEHYEEEISK